MARLARRVLGLAGISLAASASNTELQADSLSEGTTLASLLSLREKSERSWTSELEDWCKSEQQKQEEQKAKLTRLRNAAAPVAEDSSPEAFEAKRLESMAKQLREQHAALAEANTTKEKMRLDIDVETKQVEALTALEKDMVSQLSQHIASEGQSKTTSKLLKDAKEKLQKAEDVLKQKDSSLPALESKRREASEAYSKQAGAFQERKTARLAAQAAQNVVASALEEEEVFDADLHSVCSVGHAVQQRLEGEIAPVLKQVLQFVDAASQAKPAEKPTTSAAPAVVPTTPAPAVTTPAAFAKVVAVPVVTTSAPPAVVTTTAPPAVVTTVRAASTAAPVLAQKDDDDDEDDEEATTTTVTTTTVAPLQLSQKKGKGRKKKKAPVTTTTTVAPAAAEEDDEDDDAELATTTVQVMVAKKAKSKKAKKAPVTTTTAAPAAEEDAPEEEATTTPAPVLAAKKKSSKKKKKEPLVTTTAAAAAEDESSDDTSEATTAAPAVLVKKKASASKKKKEVKTTPAPAEEDADTPAAEEPAALVAATTTPKPAKVAKGKGKDKAALDAKLAMAAPPKDIDDDAGEDGEAALAALDKDPDLSPAPSPPAKKTSAKESKKPKSGAEAKLAAAAPPKDIDDDAGADGKAALAALDKDDKDSDIPASPPPPKKKPAPVPDISAAKPPKDVDDDAGAAAQADLAALEEDPDLDDAKPTAMAAKKKKSKKKKKKHSEDDDDLGGDGDSASEDAPPPPPAPAPKKAHKKSAEEKEADAAAVLGISEDALDDDSSPPPKKKAAAMAASSEGEDGGAPAAPAPTKGGKKKHKFKDQTTDIVDLVQTPNTYSAWKPNGGADSSAVATKSDIEAAEKAFDAGDDDDDAEAAPAHHRKKKKHHAVDADDAGDSGADAAPATTQAPVMSAAADTSGGGLQEAIKKKKAGGKGKKHHFEDQASSIIDLVQTPQAYAAWTPSSSSSAQATASAKNDLLAAEKAFDSDGDSFLQVASTPTHHGKLRGAKKAGASKASRAVSKLVLEKFAASLGSPALTQLANANLDLKKLRVLAKKLEVAGAKAQQAQDEHQAEELKWCQDFQKQDATASAEALIQSEKIAMDSTLASTKRAVLEREVATQKAVLDIFEVGSSDLTAVQKLAEKQASNRQALLQRLRSKVRQAASKVEASSSEELKTRLQDVLEVLGKAEGIVASASEELQDIVHAGKTRHADMLDKRGKALAEVSSTLEKMHQEKDGNNMASAALAQTGSASDESLKMRYRQMCSWTLADADSQKRKLAGEQSAISAAIAVLSGSM